MTCQDTLTDSLDTFWGWAAPQPGKYCDVPLGLYVVRGDSIVLMGEIDSDKESQMKLEKLIMVEFV